MVESSQVPSLDKAEIDLTVKVVNSYAAASEAVWVVLLKRVD